MQPEFFDISLPVHADMVRWPRTDSPEARWPLSMAAGDPVNESVHTLNAHTGTHIDAPRHFLKHGSTIDQLPLDVLVGSVYVSEIAADDVIEHADLEKAGIPTGTSRLLLRTRNSTLWSTRCDFDPDYVSVGLSAANWMVNKGIRLVGIDYLSVEKYGGNGEVHRRLLDGGIVVVEGLNLSEVATGEYWLACLPLRLVDAEAAPARAVLVKSPQEAKCE